MRKAYKKARWLKAFSRIEKRGGKVFVCYKTVKEEPLIYRLIYEEILKTMERIGVDVTIR